MNIYENKEYKNPIEKGQINLKYLIILPILFSIFSIFISDIKYSISIQFTNYSNLVFAFVSIFNGVIGSISKIIFIDRKFFNFLKIIENKIFTNFLISLSVLSIILIKFESINNIKFYYSLIIFIFSILILQMAFINSRFIILKKTQVTKVL
tara:strand:+ start:56 stop:511 length:456 start_codon:yes stop_codon:yes gene_type:complete